MNTLLASLFLLSFLASTVFSQLTVNSLQNVVQCQPSLITWSGGTPPYFLSILPAGQPSAAPLLSFGQQTGTSLTWVANITTGNSGFLELRDSTGTLAQSGSFTVLASSDSSCINASGGTTSGTSASTTTGSAAGTATGTATVPATSVTAPVGSSAAGTTGGTTRVSQSTSSTSTAAAQPKSSSAAAVSHYAPVGPLAIIGAAALAIVL